MIELKNLCKTFGSHKILKDINLKIAPSEKVVLIGPSGSGKSTLARLLMTLEQPTTGEITIDGTTVWDRKEATKEAHLRKVREKIGMVFQHYHLFPHMNLLENCMTALIHVKKEDRETAEQKATKMLERVGLKAQLYYYPKQLSGGQKQRAAIARALVMEPKIMLFDEVTSALDPELVGEVLSVIRSLALEEHMTMLLITHEIEFARDIADRIIFLDDGKIIEEGTPEYILHHTNNQRLQTFLQRFLIKEH